MGDLLWTSSVVTGVVPSPPRYVPFDFCSALGSAFPLLVDYLRNVANSRSHAFRVRIIIFFLMQEKVPTSMHSVSLEPTELILLGTRTIYQATGDAGLPMRGTILNRTHGTHKNLYISLFLLTIFGPIYYGPP